MNFLDNTTVQCPWCWESIEVVVDTSAGEQDYIEDCSVCCHPIRFHINVDESGQAQVDVVNPEE